MLKQLPSLALSGLRLGSTSLSLRMIDVSRERVGVWGGNVCADRSRNEAASESQKPQENQNVSDSVFLCIWTV